MNPSILISGCTKGIGLSITKIFAQHGFNVAGCARNKSELQALFTELSTSYPTQQFFMEACDVSSSEMLKLFAQDVINEFKTIDVLVNNAGVFLPGTILDEPEGALETQFQTNVASAYYLSQIISLSTFASFSTGQTKSPLFIK
jgi:short-subunit dehydrogenase